MGLGAASHLQLCWWLCFNQQTPRILLPSAWVRGWQGGCLPGHKEKEEALRDWKKSAFSSGHILQTGPFVPGGWYPLLTTNRSLPGLSFFSSSQIKAILRVRTSISTPAPNLCKLFSLKPILLSHWVPKRCVTLCRAAHAHPTAIFWPISFWHAS